MFEAKVYRVMLGCLGGVHEELYVARRVIKEYNQKNAQQTGNVLLPMEFGIDLEDVDVVIGIVANSIDSTDVIIRAVKAGKEVALLFSQYNDKKNTIPSELQEVVDFREKMKEQCCCMEYNGAAEFEVALKEYLKIADC